MQTAKIITLGCRLNAGESLRMAELAHEHKAAAIIINSCAVTGEAERQTRQTIRRARKQNPSALIALTGCGVEISPARFAAMPQLDVLISNRDKIRPETFARLARRPVLRQKQPPQWLPAGKGDLPLPWSERNKKGERLAARAVLPVQTGCDHRCTFCVIPQGRGLARSLPPEAIIRRARALLEAGVQEITLTGVDIASYGRGAGEEDWLSLGGLAAALLRALPDLPRLRLSSLDPALDDPLLWELAVSEPRLMPHLHFSAQAGSAMILKRMRRRHQPDGFYRLLDFLRRRRDMVFGADLIAGFPTETERQFADSAALITGAPLTYLHIFPFAARPGSPAARMPLVPAAIIRARAAALRALGQNQLDAFLARQQGRILPVLIESAAAGLSKGRTETYAPVMVSGRHKTGAMMAVKITGQIADRITGGQDGVLRAVPQSAPAPAPAAGRR